MDVMLLFISGAEIVVILLVVLMLFGSKKLPELARGLGKGMREFRQAADDLKREIHQESDVLDEIDDFKDDLTKKM